MARGQSYNQGDSVEIRTCVLWFPIELDVVAEAVTIRLAWPEAGLADQSLTLPIGELRAAAAQALVP